ncbi:acyltransferase [Thiothrix unzii]|uniref:Acyltransferase n=1 Tax=Thiothrix unzii TaxID=111769 RepID=A0A975II87_9GAMM|nr:acyltransferase [Thiothrix unzii]QTR53480.1 acyltransferase [Thiothrix unzii]
MPYYTQPELENLGFKSLGKNIKVSTLASIYNHEQIILGDNSRIDDFCLLSGKIKIGNFVHITPYCLLAGGEKGITIEDFCTLAYGVKVFTQSDDYSGVTMTNSTIPKKYKKEFKAITYIKRHSIIGTGATIMPGVTLEEGTSIGAMALVLNNTQPWKIYTGTPAKPLKARKKDLLKLEKEFLFEINQHDSIQ